MSQAAPVPAPSPEGPFAGFHRVGFGAAAAVCVAVTLVRLAALAIHPLDLHPDEAQYWSWSRHLAWGYFSKPPMIAWLIAAQTAVCGAGEGCIEAGSPLLHLVTALFLYGIGRRLYAPVVGFFAAVAYVTLPGVSFSSAIASTDPPMMTFWAIALYALVRLWQGETARLLWWTVLGLAIGFGLLSKYAMAFFVIGLVLLVILDRDARARLAMPGPGSREFALALVLGFLLYLPNLLWNIESGFVTFVHTTANADLRGQLFHPAKLSDFIITQFGVFGPILFAALLWVLVRVKAWRHDPRTRLLAAFILPMLGSITVLSLLSRANANWAAPCYIAATVWVTAALIGGGRRGLVLGSLGLNGVVAAAMVVAMLIHVGPGVYAGFRVPPELDVYKQYDGWRELGAAVTKIRARYPGAPLVLDERKLLAEMLYYVRPWPEDVFAWRPDDRITDQFKMTRPLPGTPGGNFLVIASVRNPSYMLRHFRSTRLVATLVKPIGLGTQTRVRVFYARGFLGYNASRS